MSYLEIIDKNKDNYFYKFADKFFGENAWISAKSNDDASIAFIVAFYTVIQSRCNANDDVASRIVYNSMKKKCNINENYDEFKKILEKFKLKSAAKGLIPFVKTKIEKNFEVFEQLYAMYEMKYVPMLD